MAYEYQKYGQAMTAVSDVMIYNLIAYFRVIAIIWEDSFQSEGNKQVLLDPVKLQ